MPWSPVTGMASRYSNTGRGRADLADRVDEPADHLERGLAAAEDEGDRVERPDGAHDALGREVEGEQQRAEPCAAQAELERLDV